MTSHGNPMLALHEPAPAGGWQVALAPVAGAPVWVSHGLPVGAEALTVDARGGNFVGRGRGWSVLPPAEYLAHLLRPGGAPAHEEAFARVAVGRRLELRADLAAAADSWLGASVGWHTDGSWRPVATAAVEGIRSAVDRAYLFVDAAMHGTLVARFVAPESGSDAEWGLIVRHYNANNHLRVVLRRDGDAVAARLERVAADADPQYPSVPIAAAEVPLLADQECDLVWHFNGTSHAVELAGQPLLAGHDGYMGGVEVVGLFADAGSGPASSQNGAVWTAFELTSSQWVPKHQIHRGSYSAVVRPGNVHELHIGGDRGRHSNLCWESGVQFGHIGGSEIKFTQGATLDLMASGPVLDLARWRGPMPKFVDQDDDVRGYARGTATFHDHRVIINDWVAVRVRRSVGPDFDLLGRALTGPARFAAANAQQFTDWQLPPAAASASAFTGIGSDLFPATLVFPFAREGAAGFLLAVVGGLLNVEGAEQARAFAWQCPRGLTASHDLRIAPTTPGHEYGFWIALGWLVGDHGPPSLAAAERAALRLRDDFAHPAGIDVLRGAEVEVDQKKEQPAAALHMHGCFDRALGAYRVAAVSGGVQLRLDPLQTPRDRPVFCVHGLAGATVMCSVDGDALDPAAEVDVQTLPPDVLAPHGALLVALRRVIERPVTLEIRGRASTSQSSS